MDVFSGIASIFGGGITGLIGSVTQRVFEYKSKKLDLELQKEKYSNEIALKKVEIEASAQEWAAKGRIATTQADAMVAVEDSKTLSAAITSEPKVYHDGPLTKNQNWFMVALDMFRGIIRPGLTVYLCVLVTAIYAQSKMLLRTTDISTDQAFDLVTQIINTVLYVWTSATLFWFGTRNPKK